MLKKRVQETGLRNVSKKTGLRNLSNKRVLWSVSKKPVHVLLYIVLLGDQVAETQQVARLYFALLLEVDRIQQEPTPQPSARGTSCTEHVFHCTVAFS